MAGALKTVRGQCWSLSPFFHTLFQWIVAYDCVHVSSFHDFFYLFSFFG
jgi:hypothetical protein